MKGKKMKYIFLTIISLIFIFGFGMISLAKYNDIPEGSYYFDAVNNLVKMGVINGYDDGTFRPNGEVTRAQFVKMIVMAMGKEKEAAALKNSTIFSDVSSSNWAVGYINLAIKNNIITGYVDGSFKPNQNINYAQAITVMLRSLGYGTAEMSGVWPQNYIEKGKALEISKGINLNPTDKVTRAAISVMLERALNTKINGTNQVLADKSELGAVKTAIITNSSAFDSTLPEGTIKTDLGDFKTSEINDINYLGKKINLLVNTDNEIVSTQSVEQDSHVLFVSDIAGNRITYVDKNGAGALDIPDNLTFYYSGNKKTFQDIRANISVGSIIALAQFKANKSLYDYGVLIGPITSEPIVVSKNVTMQNKKIGTLDISQRAAFTVLKEGTKADFNDIKQFDVVYYVKNPFKSDKKLLLVYDDKTSGSYEEALPNKSSVNKIKILGKELDIETSYAAAKLNDSKGAYSIGDFITVLTGKAGKIVDVISPDSTDISNMAVVVSTREGVSQEADKAGKKIYYVKLFKIDGTTVEYETNEDQSQRKGKLIRFDIFDDIASITPVVYQTISGRLNNSEKMIGDKWLSQNAIILDIGDRNTAQDITVTRLDWQDIATEELDSNKILHTELGGPFGDIQMLVLDNFAGAGQYGILTAKNERASSGSYTLIVNGQQVSYSVSSVFTSNVGDVVYIEKESYGLNKMITLSPKDTSNEIQAVDLRRIKINNRIYKLAKDVQIYDIKNNTKVSLSINDLSAGQKGYVALFTGVQTGTQDLIKVIEIDF